MELKNKITDTQRKLIFRYAENDMNLSKAAKKEYMDRNTVSYHFNKVKNNSGYDPRCFFDLVELLKLLGYHTT